MLVLLLLVLQLVNAYSLFTYVGDINATQCVCAIKHHPLLNEFLWYYRFIPITVFSLMFGIFAWRSLH
jgi:hypothetical protein